MASTDADAAVPSKRERTGEHEVDVGSKREGKTQGDPVEKEGQGGSKEIEKEKGGGSKRSTSDSLSTSAAPESKKAKKSRWGTGASEAAPSSDKSHTASTCRSDEEARQRPVIGGFVAASASSTGSKDTKREASSSSDGVGDKEDSRSKGGQEGAASEGGAKATDDDDKVSKWAAAASSLGDGARQNKFLRLMGVKKDTVSEVRRTSGSGAATDAIKAEQEKQRQDLEKQFERSRNLMLSKRRY